MVIRVVVLVVAFLSAWAGVALGEPAAAVPTPSPFVLPQIIVTPEPTRAPTPEPLPVYEDTVEAEQEATPREMVAPEPMEVKITLTNDGEVPVGNIRICRDNGEVIAEAKGLPQASGAPYVFVDAITPTDAQLDAGQIVYLIRYTLGIGLPGEAEEEQALIVPVTKIPAEPGVEFTRSIPVKSLKAGEKVAIAYKVKNTGNVALTHLSVSDGTLGEVGALDRLDPGERQTFISQLEIDETFTSKPTLTYSHRATRDTFEKTLAGSVVYLADEQLDISLSADVSTVSPGGKVTLTYRVVNSGSANYDHLHLSDPVLGDLVTLPTELRPGQEYVYTKTVVVKNTTTFLFVLRGRSEGGSDLEASSNPLTVAVMPVIEDVRLQLKAEADHVRVSGPSTIHFTLTVKNAGELDLRNVRIFEQERGDISTLVVLAPGDTVVQKSYDVEEPGQYRFMAELTDASGGRLVVPAESIDISFDQSGAPAQLTSPADPVQGALHGTPGQLPETQHTFIRMIVGVVVVLVVLTICIAAASASRSRKKRRQRDKRLRKLRRSYRRDRQEELDKTRPHAPVAPKDKAPGIADTRKPGTLAKKDKEGN